MRTAEIELDGVIYPLCYSTRVVRAIVDQYGSMEEFGRRMFAMPAENDGDPDAVTPGAGGAMETLPVRIWLLAQEMDAGARYARLNGQTAPKPLSEEELWDCVSGTNCGLIIQKALEAIVAGNETSVEAELPKK